MKDRRARAAGLLGTLLAAQMPGIAYAECKLASYGTLPVEMVDERATTHVTVNGHDARFILDTGAFISTMSRSSVQALGLKPLPIHLTPELGSNLGGHAQLYGIGGAFQAGHATIDHFGVLGGDLRHIDFVVGGSDTGAPLIGANLLDSADLDLDLANGKVRLMKADGCEGVGLAYWVTNGVFQTADLIQPRDTRDRSSHVDVVINGKHVTAVIDTGAPTTVLSRRAAERVGIDLALARPSYAVSGFGTRSYRSWIANVNSFSLGTETVEHSQMQVMDSDITPGAGAGDDEMLLGLDFVLAHHMFVANSQHKLYFTYNGGRLFSLAPAQSNAGQAPEAGDTVALTTATDYALRGEARLTRGDPQGALADLDAAIRLDGKNAGYLVARARADLAIQAGDRALTDLDASLALAPHDVDALLLRATLNEAAGRTAAVAADIAAARAIAPAGSMQTRAIAAYYIDTGRAGEALPLLDAWIAVHGNDSELPAGLNERCWARALANRDLDGAEADCRAAIRRNGTRAGYLDSLGLTQLRRGQNAEAIATYTAALAQEPKRAWSLYGRGIARLRSGQVEAGKSDLGQAEAAMPDVAARAAAYDLKAP